MLILAIGCKDEKSTKEVSSQEQKESDDSEIQVIVDMTVKNDDTFEMFYNEDGTLDFKTNNSVRVDVKGKPETQSITFNLPDTLHVANLRFDPGQNSKQGEMVMNKLIIRLHDKEVEFNAADFFKHFNSVETIKAQPEKFSFVGVMVNGNYDPLYYGNSNLMNLLKTVNQ